MRFVFSLPAGKPAGLTGLDVEENQARRFLNDIASYRGYPTTPGRARAPVT